MRKEQTNDCDAVAHFSHPHNSNGFFLERLERLKSGGKESVRVTKAAPKQLPDAARQPVSPSTSRSRLFGRSKDQSPPESMPVGADTAVASLASESGQAAEQTRSRSLGRLSRMLSLKSSKSDVQTAASVEQDALPASAEPEQSADDTKPKSDQIRSRRSWIPKVPHASPKPKSEDSNTSAAEGASTAGIRNGPIQAGSVLAVTAAPAAAAAAAGSSPSLMSRARSGLMSKSWSRKKGASQQQDQAPVDSSETWATPSGTPYSSTTDISSLVKQRASGDSSPSSGHGAGGSGRPSAQLQGADAGAAGIGQEVGSSKPAGAAAAGAAQHAAVSPFQAESRRALKQETHATATNTHPAESAAATGTTSDDGANAPVGNRAVISYSSTPAQTPEPSPTDAPTTTTVDRKKSANRRAGRLTSWWLGGKGRAADATQDDSDDASNKSLPRLHEPSSKALHGLHDASSLPSMGTSPSAPMPFGKPPKGAGLRVLVPDVDAAVSIGVGTPGVGTPLTAASSLPVTPLEPGREPSVRKFPRAFMWGTATSAHQVEGAYLDDGKGLSIWDAFTHAYGKVSNGATADISCCHYYRYKEDVALMRTMGIKYYRMSISWSRVLPTGRGRPNERGLAFYDRLIDELVANGIEPVVTLYHWDLPLSLQMEEDGWLNPNIIDHFARYAKLCYSRYGDRVKHWITFNEPWCSAVLGHDSGGQHAPGRTLDPSREVYRVGHHMLLAHAKAYHVYSKLYKRKQRGKVGMALNGDWYEARPSPDPEEQLRNEAAAKRALEFTIGWFARPLYEGDYPAVMRARVGNRLPRFTAVQRMLLKGSADFFGLNHYSSHLCEQPLWYKELPVQQPLPVQPLPVQPLPSPQGQEARQAGDEASSSSSSNNKSDRSKIHQAWVKVAGGGSRSSDSTNEIQEGEVPTEEESATASSSKSGTGSSSKNLLLLALEEESDEPLPVDPYIQSSGYWHDIGVEQSDGEDWKTTDMGWGVHPEGIRKMLAYIQAEFNPRGGIIITENGAAVKEQCLEDALKDSERVAYFKSYLTEVHKSIVHDDVDVRGFFAWSLLDNFEWGYGFTKKFGLHHVDMATLERTPKASAHWFAKVVQRNRLELGPKRSASAAPLGRLSVHSEV